MLVAAYHAFWVDRIVAETNYGGALVEANLRSAEGGSNLPYTGVHARQGKALRAEQVSALTEQGKDHTSGRSRSSRTSSPSGIPGTSGRSPRTGWTRRSTARPSSWSRAGRPALLGSRRRSAGGVAESSKGGTIGVRWRAQMDDDSWCDGGQPRVFLKRWLEKNATREWAEALANDPTILKAFEEPDDTLIPDVLRAARESLRMELAISRFIAPQVADRLFGVRWAIKNDDLSLLAKITSGLTSATTLAAGHVPAHFVVPAVLTTVVVNMFLFFRGARKKGVNIDSRQFDVLRSLKSSECGQTIGQIEGWLQMVGRPSDPAEIESTLAGLEKIRMGNGVVTALVNKAADGRWSAADL